MSELRVIALDPGEKVGWARALIQPDATWEKLEHGITDLRTMAVALGSRITAYDLIVCESFRLSATKAKSLVGSDFPTVQFIGMVRYLSWHTDTRLVMQGPSIKATADKTAPDWLQEIIDNEPKAHDDAHNVDALRHLWFWTWKNIVAKEAR